MKYLKARTLCLPCTIRTAWDVARRATEDENLQSEAIFESMRWLLEGSDYSDLSPSVLHTRVCQITKEVTGDPDAFDSDKEITNRRAKRVASKIEERIEKQGSFRESFRLVVKASICGNSIDFEVEEHDFSPENMGNALIDCLDEELSIDDIDSLMEVLEGSREVLYLLDNAGEIAFDKILIEKIQEGYDVDLTAVVKESPVLNDATMKDAEQVNLPDVVPVTTTGNGYIGVHQDSASEEFLDSLESADLIMAKGQGCYESLTELNLESKICYILKAKCVEVAKNLGVEAGEGVLKVVG